ncbi:MAG TPA: disulfide oxidoreductase [Spirochaetota bacterium]|nr:disulfide oxidoreductase [Spirochaetota bacterium]
MKIELDTTVEEALKMPGSAGKVFKKYDLYCAGCHGSSQDTISRVIINNGLDPEKFLNDLNSSIE